MAVWLVASATALLSAPRPDVITAQSVSERGKLSSETGLRQPVSHAFSSSDEQ